MMKAIAFVAPGTHTIFCMDGTNKDFIHHELFHDFLSDQRPIEKRLMNDVMTEVNLQSTAYDFYRASCQSVYDSISIDDIIEEITCDLCEYAMSGSEKMYNRLNGLFEGDYLETLAEQAREVFEANREAAQKNAAAETGGETRYYLEGYTDHQKENWAGSKSIVVYESDAQLEQFIDDALNKRNLDKKMYFGRVPSDLAQRVMEETGRDSDE